MKDRPSISADLKRRLMLECGFKCSMPRCGHEGGLEIHHIDEDPSNNAQENLIVLCAVHHSMVTKKSIDRLTIKTLKELLHAESRFSYQRSKSLNSRKKYFEYAFKYLNDSDSYRSTLIGPIFLHPSFYVDIRNRAVQLPNYDKALLYYVIENTKSRNHNIRFIFRNVNRYLEKIEQYVSTRNRKIFIEGVLENIDLVWGDKGEKGADLVCIDTGFLQVEMIFSNAFISSFRRGPSTPISRGRLYYYLSDVERAISDFDAVFDSSSRGHDNELKELIKYIKNLW